MALLRKLNLGFFKPSANIFRKTVTFIHDVREPANLPEEVKKVSTTDLPVKMESPFVEEKPKCLLCELDIEPDFKNVRFLSQFVSRHTGKIYSRHITGLCKEKQASLVAAIAKARVSGLMAGVMKNPNYFNDPKLFDPWRSRKVI